MANQNIKVVVIDGQGGKLGKQLIEGLKHLKNIEIYAIGTNSIATANMLNSGAHFGATGENPVIVNSEDAQIIIGPIGIVIANSLIGEVSEKMAVAIGKSKAEKVLIPINRCNNYVVGVNIANLSNLIEESVKKVEELLDLLQH